MDRIIQLVMLVFLLLISPAYTPRTALSAEASAMQMSPAFSADLSLTPDMVPISLFFGSARILVKGAVPQGCTPVLIIKGEDQDMTMNIRGKKFGIWMNVGSVVFKNAPAFYQCLTFLTMAEAATEQAAFDNGIGFNKIKTEMEPHIESDSITEKMKKNVLKEEFIEFKKDTGLYSVRERALAIIEHGKEMDRFEGEILIPARAPEGLYQVTLLGFKDGTPVVRSETSLPVKLVGSVAFLRELAMVHGWIYGIMAVVVALSAGFGVGLMMRSRSGRATK